MHLACFDKQCGATFEIDEVIYACSRCGGLLEVQIDFPDIKRGDLKNLWRDRRKSNVPVDQSGVWRYREFLPAFDLQKITTLREGDTPLLDAPRAAEYAGL